jgi:hypothetical protein
MSNKLMESGVFLIVRERLLDEAKKFAKKSFRTGVRILLGSFVFSSISKPRSDAYQCAGCCCLVCSRRRCRPPKSLVYAFPASNGKESEGSFADFFVGALKVIWLMEGGKGDVDLFV